MNNFWKKLNKPFTVLAPMEGVTDYVFREVVSNYLPKPDVLFTEFTNIEALNSEGYDKTIYKLKFDKSQKPIVAQIWGTNPENFFKTAKLIEKLGFDGLDINMGCPVKEVTKIGGGAALINNLKLVKEIISATKKGLKNIPLSIKTRLGYDKVVTDEWISFLLEQKIDALSIHARTAKQKSLGDADWDEIKRAVLLKNKISKDTIIVGNGDVKSYQEVIEKHKKYEVDGIMIGRGIFTNPWVFDKKDIIKHKSEDYKNVLINHLNLYEPSQNFDNLKKFFKMYINNFKGAKQLRIKLMDTKSIKEALALILEN